MNFFGEAEAQSADHDAQPQALEPGSVEGASGHLSLEDPNWDSFAWSM